MLDRAMAEPILNGARVMALVGQRVAAAMAEHVRVNQEGESGALANALD